MPRFASSFAMKSVASRRPRPETKWPSGVSRVLGGSRMSGAAVVIGAHNRVAASVNRAAKPRSIRCGGLSHAHCDRALVNRAGYDGLQEEGNETDRGNRVSTRL